MPCLRVSGVHLTPRTKRRFNGRRVVGKGGEGQAVQEVLRGYGRIVEIAGRTRFFCACACGGCPVAAVQATATSRLHPILRHLYTVALKSRHLAMGSQEAPNHSPLVNLGRLTSCEKGLHQLVC
jgi:hypothetical protein